VQSRAPNRCRSVATGVPLARGADVRLRARAAERSGRPARARRRPHRALDAPSQRVLSVGDARGAPRAFPRGGAIAHEPDRPARHRVRWRSRQPPSHASPHRYSVARSRPLGEPQPRGRAGPVDQAVSRFPPLSSVGARCAAPPTTASALPAGWRGQG
jgi:hypothetical protein